MDGLRIQPVLHQPIYFPDRSTSYRSMRHTPNVLRILGAPAFLHYILMRRAKLQPLLVSTSMPSTCAAGAREACLHTASANQNPDEHVNQAIQSLATQAPMTHRDLPMLEIDWPHKISEKEVAVYIEVLQQPANPTSTGTVLDLLF